MIRVVMLGRLGNNLFQYALGRVLAEHHQVPLVMDARWFNATGWSQVNGLLRMPLRVNIVRSGSIAARVCLKLVRKHPWEFLGLPTWKEDAANHRVDLGVLRMPANALLMGYFQSPRYFESLEAELRQEIVPRAGLLGQVSASLAADLTGGESVAIHVRRGDFLLHPAFQVCDVEYYRAAMRVMRETQNKPHFYVFSDDPHWCRAQFTECDVTVVDEATAQADPLHDLHLMSLAKHHIISNSSYSWWAAWLGKSSMQRVIAPPRWFAKDIVAPIEEKCLPHWQILTV